MSRRVLAVAGLAAAFAALAVVPASAISKPQVFSLLDVSESFHPIGGFEFNRAPRAGDAFAFTDGLYKWAGRKRGARVGRIEGLCMFTTTSGSERNFSATAHCEASFVLPAGQILVEGFIRFTEGPSNFDIPVTGGTRAYANVRGFVHIRDLPPENSDNSNAEFHLLP